MEPIYLNHKYFKLFNSLIKLVKVNHGITIKEAIKALLMQGFEFEIINETITYFLSQEYFYKIDKNEKFENSKLGIKKEPSIYLIKDHEIPEYPKLVLSLPPFNKFGLKKNLELSNINFFSIKDEIQRLFEDSEKTINICSPFLEWNGMNDFLPILGSKAKKGVDIKIISRQIDENDFQTRFNDIKNIHDFFLKNNSNIQIRNYHYHSKNYVNSSTHAKFIVCDEKVAYVGSGELRKNSFEKNFELGVIINGIKAKQLDVIFNELFSVSKEIIF